MHKGSYVASASLAAIYGLIACCCLMAGTGSSRAGWRTLAAILALLALNRLFQLDAVALHHAGQGAVRGDWYARRQPVQRRAILLMLGVGLVALAALLLWLRAAPVPLRLAAVATVTLAVFTLVRAVSLHGVDAVLMAGVGPLRVGRLFEGGLLLAIVALAWAGRSRFGGG